MFDNLTLVPHNDTEASLMMDPMNTITTRFRSLVQNNAYNIKWYGDYLLLSIANLLTIISGLTGTLSDPAYAAYYENDDYHFINEFPKTNGFGIIIHEAPSTRFNPANYPSAEYLESAQEFLKQTPHHFLKIFTVKDSKFLYVWTNKVIEPDTYYKLYALQASMFNKDNELLKNFIDALINDNIENARKVLTDYFNSEDVVNREFEAFSRCLRNQSQRQIDRLEKDIQSNRESIHTYENEIAALASKMRELNEKLAFFKYMQEDNDDHKLFYKHLRKIPYLVSFQGFDNGYIHLEYEAPLVYFSDYPAEKLIAQPARGSYSKDIIKAIIGRKYQLITKCALEFNTANFSIRSDTINNTDNVFKHPHISRYNCFGNHRQAIYDSAEKGDYIGAIEQITQAVLNLNFYDNCVIDSMCSTLIDKRDTLRTWRYKETGEMFTTNEMISRGDYYEET